MPAVAKPAALHVSDMIRSGKVVHKSRNNAARSNHRCRHANADRPSSVRSGMGFGYFRCRADEKWWEFAGQTTIRAG